jgi:hypothetical protein
VSQHLVLHNSDRSRPDWFHSLLFVFQYLYSTQLLLSLSLACSRAHSLSVSHQGKNRSGSNMEEGGRKKKASQRKTKGESESNSGAAAPKSKIKGRSSKGQVDTEVPRNRTASTSRSGSGSKTKCARPSPSGGTCTLGTQPASSFCKNHTCPADGCLASKSGKTTGCDVRVSLTRFVTSALDRSVYQMARAARPNTYMMNLSTALSGLSQMSTSGRRHHLR